MTPTEYFQGLAAEHAKVGHKENEPHFASSVEDASTLMARILYYPAVFLEEGDFSVGGTEGNLLYIQDFHLVFVEHVMDSGDVKEVQDAFKKTGVICRDFLARMIRDRKQLKAPMKRFDANGAEAHKVELEEAGLYGWFLQFRLPLPFNPVNCNEHFQS